MTTCSGTAIRTDGDTIAVAVSTIDSGLKPLGAEWNLDFYATTHKIKLPAKSPVEVDLRVINVGQIWGPGTAGKAKGTVTFGAGYKPGKMNVPLPPAKGAAKKPEELVGSWSCKK